MPESWTGRLIGKMHNNDISYEDVAKKLGYGKSYICLILNSKRKPPDIQKMMETAVNELIYEKKEAKS